MQSIPMVDLQGQYAKIKTEVDQAILGVLNSSAFINGPEVKAFQQELETYLQVKHVIPCANGTDALQIAMMALDLQPGDEVITSNFTFIATAEVIALLRLKPIVVDVDPETFAIDPVAVEKAITPNTKAIVPVHLFGQCAPMDELMAIAKKHNLYVIEDNAQAIGADYTSSKGTVKAGTIGDIGCTSFFPSKNLGCFGDGGAIFTNNDVLAEKMRQIANHGMTVRYYHDFVGVNSRLDSIQAAVLRIKLRQLNNYNQARLHAANRYSEELAGIDELITPKTADYSTHVFHQYTLRVKNGRRDALQKHLSDRAIPAMIYYPVPLHNQKAYKESRYSDADFPITNTLSNEVLSLPMHTELDDNTILTITNHIKAFFTS